MFKECAFLSKLRGKGPGGHEGGGRLPTCRREVERLRWQLAHSA